MAKKLTASASNQELANEIQELLRSAMYPEKSSATNEVFRYTAKNLVRFHEYILKNGCRERRTDILNFFNSDLRLYYDYLIFEFSDNSQMQFVFKQRLLNKAIS